MGRNGAVMEFSKYASDAMSLSRDRYAAPKHKFTIYTYMPTYIWRFPIINGGAPKSSKSQDHFRIETYGDLGILHVTFNPH